MRAATLAVPPATREPAAATAKRLLTLALWGRLLKPQVVPGGPENERWARAWARRWWVVVAATADQARSAITRYERKLARTSLAVPVKAKAFGILNAGRNAGGPSVQPPWEEKRCPRPSPSAAARRRANARGPTDQGASSH